MRIFTNPMKRFRAWLIGDELALLRQELHDSTLADRDRVLQAIAKLADRIDLAAKRSKGIVEHMLSETAYKTKLYNSVEEIKLTLTSEGIRADLRRIGELDKEGTNA